MPAAESTDLAEKIFRELLTAAIARGRQPHHTARAAEYAAIDNLVAQLRITYPTVAPEAIATTVRRIHADFDTRNDRDLIPLFVEQAVREHLA